MKKVKAIMSPKERVAEKDYYNMAKKQIMKRGGLTKAQKGKPVQERTVKYSDGTKKTVVDSSGYYWNKGRKNMIAIENLKKEGMRNPERDSLHNVYLANYKRQAMKGQPGYTDMGFPEKGAVKIETKKKTTTAPKDSTAAKPNTPTKKRGGVKKYQRGGGPGIMAMDQGQTGYYDLAKKHIDKIESNKKWSDTKKTRKTERFLKKIDPSAAGKKNTFDRVIQAVDAAARVAGAVSGGPNYPSMIGGPPPDFKKGGSTKKVLPKAKGGKWIQKATASIKRRGTEGVCTGSKFGSPSCPPGSKRYNLAKTFKKMAKKK